MRSMFIDPWANYMPHDEPEQPTRCDCCDEDYFDGITRTETKHPNGHVSVETLCAECAAMLAKEVAA